MAYTTVPIDRTGSAWDGIVSGSEEWASIFGALMDVPAEPSAQQLGNCYVAEMPESQLSSVVIHELAHISRGDFLANRLGSVAMLLYWPSPLFCLRLQFLEHKMVAYGELRIRCSREIQRWAIESSRL